MPPPPRESVRTPHPERARWLDALEAHEREIGRLHAEIATLERERHEAGESGPVPAILRLQIELASAQLARLRDGAMRLAERLRASA